MIKVKVCGITNLADARAAIRAGCDALGFVFYKKSPRYLSFKQARQIIVQLPRRMLKVGVFVNAREKSIRRVVAVTGVDMLQFHGDESADFCRRFKGLKVIKAFKVKGAIDAAQVNCYDTFAYLFDTFSRVSAGGTGRSFNWQALRRLKGIKKIVFLSGGLNEKNVRRAIRMARPQWIDACSSLECCPGKKDWVKLSRFMRRAKGKEYGL